MARKGQFVKGNKMGELRGPNKLTKTVKERVMATFEELQEDPKANLTAWAKQEPTEFYKIAAKLIPTELKGNLDIQTIQPLIIQPVEPIEQSPDASH